MPVRTNFELKPNCPYGDIKCSSDRLAYRVDSMKYLSRPHILFLVLLFSPYLVKKDVFFCDIRFDHILLILMGFYIILSGKLFRSVEFIPFFFLFALFSYSTYISTVVGRFSYSKSLFVNIIEWYGRGIIILLFCKYFYTAFDKEHLIDLLRAVIFASVLVNVIALCQLFPPYDEIVNPFLQRYYSGTSVEGRPYVYVVLRQGRAISILSQTGTAGLYALLVFSILLFLGPNNLKIQIPVFLALLVQSIIGGYLPKSKAFTIGVPIVLLIYCLRMNTRGIIQLVLVVVVVCFITYCGFKTVDLQGHTSYAQIAIQRLISPGQMYASTFEPRFGEDRALDETIDIIKHNWGIGVGVVSGIRICDSQWIPLLVFGGIVGLACYVWYIYRAVKPVFLRKHVIQSNEQWGRQVFTFYVAVLFIYAIFGIGSPTFSQDKTGDFFWILTALLSNVSYNSSNQL